MRLYIAPAFSIRLFSKLISCFAILFLLSCEKEKKDPVFETINITGISSSEYYVSAKITEKGDYKIYDHGFMYYIGNENGGFYNNQKVSLGSIIETDTFATIMNIGNTNYYSGYLCYARAYITNEKGTLYGNIISTDLVRLTLKSIVPAIGKSGDTITLNGIYFNPIPSENHVSFNYTSAQVISGTATSLRVIVPSGISSYYGDTYVTVNVESDGTESSLENKFKLLADPEGFYPTYGSWDTYIDIIGTGMYNASVYFDDVYITQNTTSSSNFSVNIPDNFNKKKFKLYLSVDGVKTEVPGGYFTMNDLIVNPPSNSQYSRGSSIYLSGDNFNPNYSYNKLMLGTNVLNSNSGYSSYAYFNVPNSFALGTYQAKVTNGLDTITLSNPITIVAK